MLRELGFTNLNDFIDAVVPPQIRSSRPLDLPAPRNEHELLSELRGIAGKNQVWRSFIGMGYHDCVTPAVIQRNVLENPAWYTPYTPYQAEIAQGRLEAMLNFQTMVIDLTKLDIANASLLDEATAAAEAMTMCHGIAGDEIRNRFFVSANCHPQTIAVVQTRAQALGIPVVVGDHRTQAVDASFFGVLVQYPATDGVIFDYREFFDKAHAAGAMTVVAADLLALALLVPPGEIGADVAIGSAQRFGVPMGYGGPHAAFLATRNAFKRQMPGRLVGVSKDAHGRPACRLSLQTREQHIRREKATSNICTAQALLANMASMYAVYHGPTGIRRIAEYVHRLTAVLADGLKRLGHQVGPDTFFDTLRVQVAGGRATEIADLAAAHRINLRFFDNSVLGISMDEAASAKDIAALWQIFNHDKPAPFTVDELASTPGPLESVAGQGASSASTAFPIRQSTYLADPVFNRHHSEAEMLRYIRSLENKDLSLAHSMIPLGSCTMKLNATSEMLPVTWPEFSKLHPFAPVEQAAGYQILFKQLSTWLSEITGFAAVSLQPNAGAQGEYAGLLAIREYHRQNGGARRNICLIPQSAHGTNPASAVMAGLKVTPVVCDKEGNIDVADLRAKAEAHREDLAALMVTYPSTHGVFEESIKELCRIVHDCGGQVYMDGANLNAQVGLTSPALIGADVCHLNLHKTFCIPHGGGGPGVGPIAVAAHLAPFLPGHPLAERGVPSGPPGAVSGPVSGAPWGSASLLPISWVYIACMGAAGLTEASAMAILNANYIARRLDPYYPVVYRGGGGFVAHECIIDLRQFKTVTAEDVAKRLMDYGFHAPTLSWPVAGTLMIEPTESEPREELDRFCDALIAIHAEIQAVESGQVDPANNLLKNAPHTADQIAAAEWNRPYTREQAAFPSRHEHEFKFWPAVARIDNVHGDRNPVCTCVGMEAY